MPNFRYRALTTSGEIVSGLIAAPTAAEVARRIDYLRLVPIDTIVEESATQGSRFNFRFEKRARAEDVTIFTLDLALLLKAGARLDRALELLAADVDIGRLRSTVSAIRSSVLAGESFADALAHHPALFPPMYVKHCGARSPTQCAIRPSCYSPQPAYSCSFSRLCCRSWARFCATWVPRLTQ
jgi:general secretion pathway protein F